MEGPDDVSGIVIKRVRYTVLREVVIVHGCFLNAFTDDLHTPPLIVFTSVYFFVTSFNL